LHMVAWAVPATQTIIVLVMRKVDADPTTALCYVGGQDRQTLLAFVLVPLAAYLGLGLSFLLAGFVSLFRIRGQVRRDGLKTDKLETLMVRIGVFSVLYTGPAACVIGCALYEYMYRHNWYSPHSTETPPLQLVMLKVVMSLVIGTTSGMWLWSSKTILSWQRFFTRIKGGPSPGQKQSQAAPAFPKYHYTPSHATTGSRTTPPNNSQPCTPHLRDLKLSHGAPHNTQSSPALRSLQHVSQNRHLVNTSITDETTIV